MAQTSSFVVVDIGGTKIRSAIWNGNDVSEIQSFETPKVSAPDFLQQLLDHLQGRRDAYEFLGVGVSTAGPVDVANGAILNPANLGNGDSTWKRFEIKSQLFEKLKCPVSLDNDAAMTAYGQFHHCEKQKTKDLVVLTVGTGIGVAAIVNGELVRGGQSMHPEVGHFLMGDFPDENYPTPFANYPTLESYISGFHFSSRVGKALNRTLDGGELIRLSEKGQADIIPLWEEYSRRVAVALSNLYLIYFPRKIVLAGGFALVASPFYLQQAENHLGKILQGRVEAGMPLPEIEISAIHAELPLLGAGYKIQNEMGSI